jgi:serine/threonine-protein kinase
LAEEKNASFQSPLAAAADPELSAGTVLGRYVVESKLGRGGMGAVYKAHDKVLRRPVALKVLHFGRLADSETRQRLTYEARAASGLNHPNIITIYDIGRENGLDFIAAEYVPGTSLQAIS